MQETQRNYRPRFLPIFLAKPGMTLSDAIELSHNVYLCLALPAGHVLTEESLYQLVKHHAEYLYIAEPETRTPQQIATDSASAARRTLEIFRHADLGEPNMAAFFDQVLRYRSA